MTRVNHRIVLAGAVLLVIASAAAAGAAAAQPFGLDNVAGRAAALAAEPYREHRRAVPSWMLVGNTTYDQWRDIRFRPDAALWKKEALPFRVQFFHPGLYYDHSVAVNVVENGRPRPIGFSRRLFDYGKNDFADRIPDDIGFAGFRVHAPIKSPEYFDEVVVFLGASYFRAVGRDHVYGLSARGLALDTVTARPEEFPIFTDFWLVEPERDAAAVTVYALLDSPSVAGAYAFTVTPGETTRVDVEARLFFRKSVERLGLAPLTSMYFFGENSRRRFDDFRPEVHDSDGLLVHGGSGEWVWRPLENPRGITVNAFATENPRGFGLLQRDRDFASHQDLETRAERRPSAWIEPRGDWGAGAVELVQIPTDTELNDNIVAFWRPAETPGPGARLSFAYTLLWLGDDPSLPPGGRAVATRQDAGTLEGGRRFVVDFAGGSLGGDAPDALPEARVSAAGGTVEDVHVTYNDAIRGWRVGFQTRPEGAAPVELRAFLARGDDVLTETWTYTHDPAE